MWLITTFSSSKKTKSQNLHLENKTWHSLLPKLLQIRVRFLHLKGTQSIVAYVLISRYTHRERRVISLETVVFKLVDCGPTAS